MSFFVKARTEAFGGGNDGYNIIVAKSTFCFNFNFTLIHTRTSKLWLTVGKIRKKEKQTVA